MRVGDTVSLRVTTESGPTEVVGVVLSLRPDELVVRRRDGTEVTIDVSQVTAGKVVPPPLSATVDVAELERVASSGWRALAVEAVGEWLLRAGGGFTGRANSVLAVGDPGMALDAAVEAAQAWYAAQGLPARFQLPDGGIPRELAPLLAERGYEFSGPVHVMTSELAAVIRRPVNITVVLADQPDDAWLASYRQDGGALPTAAQQILVNHDKAVFAAIREGDSCVAIARAAVDGRWAGLFAVEVAPTHRRAGLGAAVSVDALKWAVQRGARRAYLQVSADNVAAVELYQSLGFATHHDYSYAVAPSLM